MSQNPEFWINETQPISDATTAAAKIRAAMQLDTAVSVELGIGEDIAVISALEELEQTGDFLAALQRLLRDLKKKLDREP